MANKPHLTKFIAAQRWLKLAGRKTAVVPFAPALSKEMFRLAPQIHIRARRDFEQLLSLIVSSALLHQRQREVDEHGNVVATLMDYRIVRDIIFETLDADLTGNLTKAQREVAVAIRELYKANKVTLPGEHEPVGIEQLAKKIGVDRSSTLRRLKAVIQKGYAEDLDAGVRGKPHRYLPAGTLPSESRALPTVEEIEIELEKIKNAPSYPPKSSAQQHNPKNDSQNPHSSTGLEDEGCGAVPQGVQCTPEEPGEGQVSLLDTPLHSTPHCTTPFPQDYQGNHQGCAGVQPDLWGKGEIILTEPPAQRHTCGGGSFWQDGQGVWHCHACSPAPSAEAAKDIWILSRKPRAPKVGFRDEPLVLRDAHLPPCRKPRVSTLLVGLVDDQRRGSWRSTPEGDRSRMRLGLGEGRGPSSSNSYRNERDRSGEVTER